MRSLERATGIHRLAVVGDPPEHREYRSQGAGIAPLVDETALLEAFVSVDAGTKNATAVGARSWLMKHVHVGHDAQIGADCEVSPGAVICGHAVLEDGVRVGVNASVLPFRRVGKGARIGAGAVVTHDVPAGEVWVGNPARLLRPKAPIDWAGREREYQGWLEWYELARDPARLEQIAPYMDAGVQLGLHRDLAEREAQLLAVCAETGVEPPNGLASLQRLRQLEELRDAAEYGKDEALASFAKEVRKS